MSGARLGRFMIWLTRRRLNSLPHSSLFGPVEVTHDRLKISKSKWSPAPFDARKLQNGFLDVGRQTVQIHDLRNPGARHVPQFGDLAVALNGARANEPIKPDGQGNQPGNSRYLARWKGRPVFGASNTFRPCWRRPNAMSHSIVKAWVIGPPDVC